MEIPMQYLPKKFVLIELELINNVQEILKKTIEQTETQIHRNRSIKEAMECNWSDKKEAEEYDTIAGVLNNGSTNKQFYSDVAKYQENMSSPEQWAQVSHDVIVRSEAERLTSEDLRGLITQLLKDISRDLIQKSDTICVEFQRNIDRLECAKTEQEQQLKQILEEVLAQERCINQLNEAIKAKDDPLKVVQTRLHMREFRPTMELCKDSPQASLIAEADMLAESLAILSSEKERAENKLQKLQNLQMNLEKEIQLKEETIRIDKIQCLPRRQAYPSREQLQGYT
ncbi:unnamed protein product [Dicrocoelium dendriticum]|nr:unnamed protein product [Dicrocoelium dendriticum]